LKLPYPWHKEGKQYAVQDDYKKKLVSAAEAAKAVKSGDMVVIPYRTNTRVIPRQSPTVKMSCVMSASWSAAPYRPAILPRQRILHDRAG